MCKEPIDNPTNNIITLIINSQGNFFIIPDELQSIEVKPKLKISPAYTKVKSVLKINVIKKSTWITMT